MGRGGASAIVLAVVVCCAARAPAVAADSRTDSAREHYLQGESFYKLSRFASALDEYERAYLAKPDPSFLYGIAQCHRMLGNREDAIRFYRNYLNDAPAAANREAVEKQIKELEAAAAKSPAAAPIKPAALAPPPLAASAPPAPAPAPVVVVSAPVAAPPTPAAPPPPAAAPAPSQPAANVLVASSAPTGGETHHPVYKRWWFWTAIGAVVLGSVGLAFALNRGSSDPSCPVGRICD
jgi:tetratricopeptide (TPR) repeat protein